jgi:hypothetical protein
LSQNGPSGIDPGLSATHQIALLEIGVSPTFALALSICIRVQRGVSR